LKLLEENQLFLKPDKCEFKKTKVEYLGVVISHNSVEMDPTMTVPSFDNIGFKKQLDSALSIVPWMAFEWTEEKKYLSLHVEYTPSLQCLRPEQNSTHTQWCKLFCFFIIIYNYIYFFNLNAAKLTVYQNGLTPGDKRYFSYQATCTERPQPDSLKRKLDTPDGSPYESKRRAV